MSVLNSCTVFSKHIWDNRDNSEPVRCHETIAHKNAIFGPHLLCPRNMSWCRRSTCFWAGRHIYLERTNNSLPLLHTNLNSLFVRIWDQSISVSPSMVDPSPFQRTQLALVQDKWKCWERVEKSFSFRNWNYPIFFKKIRNLAKHELTLTLELTRKSYECTYANHIRGRRLKEPITTQKDMQQGTWRGQTWIPGKERRQTLRARIMRKQFRASQQFFL